MLLDLGKALSFFACIVAVYHAAIHAFFVPGTQWEERISTTALKLAIVGCVCFLSGMVFTWPAGTNPDRGVALTATLPVRLFFWSSATIAVLFLSSWFMGDLIQQAAPFISSRSLQRF